ncbi:hypothetical protein IWZ01DRAFT_14692 [Phyllosticta capitalensis]
MSPTWADDASDCSDISLTSTIESEPADDYDVDCIIARSPDDDGDFSYLVRWEGYPDHRNTWEPVESFASKEAVDQLWQERLEAEMAGRTPPFDVDAWQKDQNQRQIAKERRKEKRRQKRAKKRAGRLSIARNVPEKRIPSALSTVPDHPINKRRPRAVVPDDSEDDIPLVKRRSTNSLPQLQDKPKPASFPSQAGPRPSTLSSSLDRPRPAPTSNPSQPPYKPRPVAKMVSSAQPSSSKAGGSISGKAPAVQPAQPPQPFFQRSKPHKPNPLLQRPRGPRKKSSGHIQTSAEVFRLINAPRYASPEPNLEDLNFIDPATGGQDKATNEHFARQKNLQQGQRDT